MLPLASPPSLLLYHLNQLASHSCVMTASLSPLSTKYSDSDKHERSGKSSSEAEPSFLRLAIT
ncbi:hypothetical protein GN958_ATG09619 [Phytophthora infestans]|uniref:Uncharacterized protein n=1 Tax=Phytophthora infestans TaxID=4787 RepID=A0A8S9USM1_PHYIN|nr:hypothetical protein GN958_ATG09619 [Phytophthora infestans]